MGYKNRCDSEKLNSLYYAVYNLRNDVDTEVLISFYYGCVQSRLKYGIVAWGSSPHFHRVFKAQKRIIRCIQNKPMRFSCRSLFREMKILPLPSLYLNELAIWAFNNKHNYKKNNDFFKNMTTRGCFDFSIPMHKTALFQRGPEYRAMTVFNRLPIDIKNTTGRDVFKSKVKKYMLEHQFYSYDEYFNV